MLLGTYLGEDGGGWPLVWELMMRARERLTAEDLERLKALIKASEENGDGEA